MANIAPHRGPQILLQVLQNAVHRKIHDGPLTDCVESNRQRYLANFVSEAFTLFSDRRA